MMFRLIRVFIIISIMLFLVVLMIVYAFLPETSGILFSNDGHSLQEISRNTVFYVSLVGFVLLQMLFYLFKVNVLNKKIFSNKKINISNWFNGMFLAINIFFILLLIFIGLANNAVDYTYSSIEYIAFLGPALIIIWLLFFPVFYFRSR